MHTFILDTRTALASTLEICNPLFTYFGFGHPELVYNPEKTYLSFFFFFPPQAHTHVAFIPKGLNPKYTFTSQIFPCN